METNMTKPTLYWHIHHEILLEDTTDIQERIDYIREGKPEKEIPLRLKLMTPVLHPEKLPSSFRKAREAYCKAREAYDKAREAYDKALEVYIMAGKAYDKAREAYIKTSKVYAPQIEKLHKEEHPDCPWNGETIFSKVDYNDNK